ncbi:MAG: glutamine--fructose-6-phosphate transaminase (isomerizing), partial [Gammaproteobacteria bacterium]|nr:glutamine--fructose-6-phosphate transaminase (isomerizing) [Gammaproteobacteria bacterium]
MCGIVGAASKQPVLPVLLAGLHKLEYRGYDSAGVALIDSQGMLVSARMVGNVSELEKKLSQHPLQGHIGIAHTRWATHGKPSEKNAHPHISHQRIAVVHNGIIENHHELRQQLQAQGLTFHSDTDTEVIAHLIYTQLASSKNLLDATQRAVEQLHGSFSVAILDVTEPEHIIAVRQASPLVIGLGKNQNFLASDQLALLSETQQFIYLEEGDIADISADNIIIYNAKGAVVTRPVKRSELADENVGLGNYRYFMEKEIYQQPQAITNTLEDHLASDHVILESFGEKALAIFPQVKNIQIIACGTSYHAALVARYWLERHAKIPCAVEIASEFRYRDFIVQPNTLFITISQSGETADTLAALKIAKQHAYLASLAICNVAH